jgi:hypothetical protein
MAKKRISNLDMSPLAVIAAMARLPSVWHNGMFARYVGAAVNFG